MEHGIGQLKCRGSWNRKKEKKRKNENSMQMYLCMTYHDMSLNAFFWTASSDFGCLGSDPTGVGGWAFVLDPLRFDMSS